MIFLPKYVQTELFSNVNLALVWLDYVTEKYFDKALVHCKTSKFLKTFFLILVELGCQLGYLSRLQQSASF